jgi:hypothetical protein
LNDVIVGMLQEAARDREREEKRAEERRQDELRAQARREAEERARREQQKSIARCRCRLFGSIEPNPRVRSLLPRGRTRADR